MKVLYIYIYIYICRRLHGLANWFRMKESETSKSSADNPVRLGIFANNFSFDTGRFVYQLNVLPVESFKLRTFSAFNNMTKHNLAGSEPSINVCIIVR